MKALAHDLIEEQLRLDVQRLYYDPRKQAKHNIQSVNASICMEHVTYLQLVYSKLTFKLSH